MLKSKPIYLEPIESKGFSKTPKLYSKPTASKSKFSQVPTNITDSSSPGSSNTFFNNRKQCNKNTTLHRNSYAAMENRNFIDFSTEDETKRDVDNDYFKDNLLQTKSRRQSPIKVAHKSHTDISPNKYNTIPITKNLLTSANEPITLTSLLSQNRLPLNTNVLRESFTGYDNSKSSTKSSSSCIKAYCANTYQGIFR
jgi:hypothetical protein